MFDRIRPAVGFSLMLSSPSHEPARPAAGRIETRFRLNRRMDPHGQRDSPPPGVNRARPASARPPPTGPPAGDDSGRRAPGAAPGYPKTGRVAARRRSTTQRDRQDREPYREEGPADREPIRFIRQRTTASRSASRSREREPGLTVRERLARDRAERDGGPIHHEGIPMARDRDRDGAAAVRDASGPGTTTPARPRPRDRPDREPSLSRP